MRHMGEQGLANVWRRAMTTVEAYSHNLYRIPGDKWHAEMQPSVLCPTNPPAGGEEGAVTAV